MAKANLVEHEDCQTYCPDSCVCLFEGECGCKAVNMDVCLIRVTERKQPEQKQPAGRRIAIVSTPRGGINKYLLDMVMRMRTGQYGWTDTKTYSSAAPDHENTTPKILSPRQRKLKEKQDKAAERRAHRKQFKSKKERHGL